MIDEGLNDADQLYLEDTDDSDPNLAMKGHWPSTTAYTFLIKRAAEISAAEALEEIVKVPDDEIQLALKISLADLWLKAGPGFIAPSESRHRDKNSFRYEMLNYGPRD